MVRLNRRVGYNRDTYLLCRLCDRVVMIPEQVRRKLDAGQGHIVGQVAVHFPVEPVSAVPVPVLDWRALLVMVAGLALAGMATTRARART